VTGHLAAAASSLAQAVAAAMATVPEPRGGTEHRTDDGTHGGADDGVEHIDLADDWPEDEASPDE
jgi:hypothetical protein